MGEYRHFELSAQRLVKGQKPVKSAFARLRVRPLAVAIDGGVTISAFDEFARLAGAMARLTDRRRDESPACAPASRRRKDRVGAGVFG